ncbi:hypothetical protein B9Z19DRAFT_705996 [Tuber borchii]|uniref:Uncharacterized protein n=1 Tax=Tuber borchii TaxID=42251 RepID=A0A2T7A7Z4_TUBBO|nr:hypothetical protein B9Z19DRAFT_705996 [Tuber borchii]
MSLYSKQSKAKHKKKCDKRKGNPSLLEHRKLPSSNKTFNHSIEFPHGDSFPSAMTRTKAFILSKLFYCILFFLCKKKKPLRKDTTLTLFLCQRVRMSIAFARKSLEGLVEDRFTSCDVIYGYVSQTDGGGNQFGPSHLWGILPLSWRIPGSWNTYRHHNNNIILLLLMLFDLIFFISFFLSFLSAQTSTAHRPRGCRGKGRMMALSYCLWLSLPLSQIPIPDLGELHSTIPYRNQL